MPEGPRWLQVAADGHHEHRRRHRLHLGHRIPGAVLRHASVDLVGSSGGSLREVGRGAGLHEGQCAYCRCLGSNSVSSPLIAHSRFISHTFLDSAHYEREYHIQCRSPFSYSQNPPAFDALVRNTVLTSWIWRCRAKEETYQVNPAVCVHVYASL